MKRREDFGETADAFFDGLNEPVATLALELRGLIRKALPHVSENIKWGMPVYEKDGLICAIRPAESYVALQFYGSGSDLRDPDKLLEGTGKKMRHVKVRSKKDIRPKLFTAWVKQAAGAS